MIGSSSKKQVIDIQNVSLGYGNFLTADGLSCTIYDQEIFAIVGGSGSGKSTVLKALLGLIPIFRGSVTVLGHNIAKLTSLKGQAYYKSIGVLFQEGALFGGLTVLENIAYPMHYLLGIPLPIANELALLKLALVGLEERAAFLNPQALSGGMKKRAALARALAVDPQILFLDEPTSGLDPEASGEFDLLLRELHESLHMTVVMVTHDLSTLKALTSRIGIIVRKKMIIGTLAELLQNPDPDVQKYFHSSRANELFMK